MLDNIRSRRRINEKGGKPHMSHNEDKPVRLDHEDDRSTDSAVSSYSSHRHPLRRLKYFPVGDTSLSLGLSRRRLPQVAIPTTISILSGLLSTPGLMRADRSLSEPMVKGTTFRVQGVLEIAYPG